MKCSLATTLLLAALFTGEAVAVKRQPIVTAGVGNTDGNFATAAGAGPGKPPGYRNAWDDCGGVGASATERMRTIAAKIKGWAKPLPFVRHAAQDCGSKVTGTEPGPGAMVIYPAPVTLSTAREGLETASATLAKYPAAGKK